MGQQQLLLIVLGVIIVGIAVVVGLNMFQSQSVTAARETMIADLTNLGAMAQQYAKKPAALGGGEGDCDGFTIPSNLASNAANKSVYVATTTVATTTTKILPAAFPTAAVSTISGTSNPIYLVGYCNNVGNDGSNVVQAYCTVNAATGTIATTVVN